MSDIFRSGNKGLKREKRPLKMEKVRPPPDSNYFDTQLNVPLSDIDQSKKVPEKNFAKMWDGINNETVYKVMKLDTPIISLATLSLYRYDRLFKSLEHNPRITATPLNMCLRVQASEEMPLKYKFKIMEMLETQFRHYDVQFTVGNHGSGVPRRDVVHRALKHFKTNFVLTLDDDIIMPENGIDVMAAILIDHPELGSITLSCDPHSSMWRQEGNKLFCRRPVSPFGYADAVGSGTTMTRREVFKTCDLDPKYYIGWGDMDFGKQMREAGWKIGVLTVNGFKAFNPPGQDPKYRKIRHNKIHTKASWQRYKDKWGIEIIG